MIHHTHLVVVVAFFLAAAANPAIAQTAKPAFKPDQKVEVREGDQWSGATVLKQEGRKFQIRYEDGTEEWVTSDRMRVAGGVADGPAPAKGAASSVKPASESFANGAKVEVKSTSSWKKATVKNRDGDLYLIVFDDRPDQFWWEWVHLGIVRKVGSAKEWPDWGRGVGVRNAGVAAAKEEAKRTFANIEQDIALAARGEKRGTFDPAGYDKPLTDCNFDKIEELIPTAGPAKLATFDPAPVSPRKLVERGHVLKGKGGRWQSGGPAELFIAGGRAVAAYLTDAMPSDSRTASLEIVDLINGKNAGLINADALSMPSDLSRTGNRLAGIQHGFHSGTKIRVDIHNIKPGSGLEHVISFVPYPSETRKDVATARFVGGDDDHLLTTSSGGVSILWNASTATAIWRIKDTRNARESGPAVSPGGKQIAFIDDGAMFVIEALSGEVLCRIPTDRSARDLAFTPDGKRIVGVNRSTLMCWDLEQGKALPEIGLPVAGVIGTPVALDNRFVLIGGADVLDLEKKVVVWRYQAVNSGRVHGRGVNALLAGGLCWSVLQRDEEHILTSARLPHEAARKAADSLAVGEGLLLRPGGSVSLSVAIEAAADQQQRVIDAITRQLAEAGIKVDPNSPIKLNARTETGNTTTRTYEVRQFGRPGTGQTETVSATEKITRIFVEVDGKIAWESRTSSGGAPMFVHTRQGQTVNDAVQAGSQFNIAFLESVRVPSYIPRPGDTPWLGQTTWGVSGLGKDTINPRPPVAAAAPPSGDGLE